MAESGYDISNRVDPNTSNDVCTFCRHASQVSLEDGVVCSLGFSGYFRSLSNLGPVFVSDCEHGIPKPGYGVTNSKTAG